MAVTRSPKNSRQYVVGQFRHAPRNIVAIVADAAAMPEHMVRQTWCVTDKKEFLASLRGVGEAWREIMGRVFPCIACIEVKGLMENDAKVEIETTAVMPWRGTAFGRNLSVRIVVPRQPCDCARTRGRFVVKPASSDRKEQKWNKILPHYRAFLNVRSRCGGHPCFCAAAPKVVQEL